MRRAIQLVNFLLGDETISGVLESSVHLPKRGRIWIATYTGSEGGQVWRSTGLTDRDQALVVAKDWEAKARAQRAQLRRATKPSMRVSNYEPGTRFFTQKEVAMLLKISERSVRAIERRALQKLRNHPLLRQVWREYLTGELEEHLEVLTGDEIHALLSLTRTREERLLIEKIVLLIQG